MKRLISAMMIFISVLCLISGAFAEGNEELDYNAFDSVMVSGIADFDVVFELLPEAYNATESAHPGTVERLHYTTAVYEDGVTYEKYCTVYLPYGYDPENKETKYNVLYWQHGSGGHPNELWDHQVLGQNAKNMIDNMFDEDHRVMEPCIIICPTYYVGIDESDFKSFKPQDAGGGRENGMLPNYYIEVIHDLIPQIESRYNVYCEDFSEEGIKASRDHRAWAGFSRGSVETWNLMNRDFEYFRYWFPMSAGVMPEGVSADELEEKGYTLDEKIAYVREPVEKNPELPFFLMITYEFPEGRDVFSDKDFLQALYEQQDLFSYGQNPEVNNMYFTASTYRHLDYYMPRYLYQARNILFK